MNHIEFYNSGEIEDHYITFVVTMAKYKGQWLMVRNFGRDTWELPGGRREPGESLQSAAVRELFEETGASHCQLKSLGTYRVNGEPKTYGEFFYGQVYKLEALPPLEIEEICLVASLPSKLTYPSIQIPIYQKVLEIINTK